MDIPAAKFFEIYKLLTEAQIKFILIGGAAANLQGSPQFTLDVDVVYSRDEANLRRLVDCLAPLHPYLRGAPAGLPFVLDFRTLSHGLNFTFLTDLGNLDLLGEVAGGGTYEELLPHSEPKTVEDIEVQCVNLEKLIMLKRASGRPRDIHMIAELEAIRQERAGRQNS